MEEMMRAMIGAATFICLLSAAACGGNDSPTSAGASGAVGATITITSGGVNPKNVTINSGEVVAFVNNDAGAHQISSDPHPVHTDCPPINSLGTLGPGQTRNTGNMTTSRTCGFHDHLDPTNTALQGTITIR
jgi:plastocyanin